MEDLCIIVFTGCILVATIFVVRENLFKDNNI